MAYSRDPVRTADIGSAFGLPHAKSMAMLWHEGHESGEIWTVEHCTESARHCPNINIFAALPALLLA
jgi:hypothetical protein